MFEKELSDKFKQIFGVKKVTYNDPGESQEQECLFIEVENSLNVVKDDLALAKVTGHAVIFGNADKLPFGFFTKKIRNADPSLTKDLFFFDIEANTRVFENIVQRSFGFVYFFHGQYDPANGLINAIEMLEAEL